MNTKENIIMRLFMKHTLSIVIYSIFFGIYILFPFHIAWAIIILLVWIVMSLVHVEIVNEYNTEIVPLFFGMLLFITIVYQFLSYEHYYKDLGIDKNQQYTYTTSSERAEINIIDGHKTKYSISVSLQKLPDILKNETLNIKIIKENSIWTHDPDIKRSIL